MNALGFDFYKLNKSQKKEKKKEKFQIAIVDHQFFLIQNIFKFHISIMSK